MVRLSSIVNLHILVGVFRFSKEPVSKAPVSLFQRGSPEPYCPANPNTSRTPDSVLLLLPCDIHFFYEIHHTDGNEAGSSKRRSWGNLIRIDFLFKAQQYMLYSSGYRGIEPLVVERIKPTNHYNLLLDITRLTIY
jgi:hypothetical protein